MKLWLDDRIGEAIRKCTGDAAAAADPHLSCELRGLTPKQAKDFLLSVFREWDQEFVIGYFRVGKARRERVRACLFDLHELDGIIDDALCSEKVVSVVDIAAMGGCAFDLSPEEEPNDAETIELLLTAWGAHEAAVTKLAAQLGVSTFRQGETLAQDR